MAISTYARINLAALKHNLRCVSHYAPHSKITAMIKANAYGHGLVQVAQALFQADSFGVAHLEEAVTLRQSNIKHPIIVMLGFNDIRTLLDIEKHELDTVIHDIEQIKMLELTKINKPLKTWLKIDTGMHRLGFHPSEFLKIYERLMQNDRIQKPINLITHFANADNMSISSTNEQITLFKTLTQKLPGFKSIANSAGIVNYPNFPLDYVRPGIMLYGASPLENKTGQELGLKPVMTLHSELIATKSLCKGDKISYGSTWSCPEDMPVGIVALGYADGYPRHAKNETPTLVNGKKCPLIGRVCMDMLAIDLRQNPQAKPGERVILWGQDLPVEHIAKCADTIPYELLSGITKRVRFCYDEIST